MLPSVEAAFLCPASNSLLYVMDGFIFVSKYEDMNLFLLMPRRIFFSPAHILFSPARVEISPWRMGGGTGQGFQISDLS